MIVSFVLILLVGLAGGIVPMLRKWSDRQHHAALAFSTGIFLGAVFLHLLPSVAALAAEAAAAADPHAGHDHGPGHTHEDHAGHTHGPIGMWLWVLAGVIGVFLVEALLLPGSTHGHGHGHDDHERHAAVGWAALVGLTVHALTAGVALAAVQNETSIAGVMLLAILAHKGFESFSLAAVFGMTGTSRGKVVAMVVAFSLVTPLGLVLGSEVTSALGDRGISILTSLSAGTFLYVCLCELLPEVFHRREDGPWKIGLLLLGIAAMWYAHSIGGI